MSNFDFRLYDIKQEKYLPICSDYYSLRYFGDCLMLSPLSQQDGYWPFVNILNHPDFRLEQFTGFRDIQDNKIYEGDYVSATIDLGGVTEGTVKCFSGCYFIDGYPMFELFNFAIIRL